MMPFGKPIDTDKAPKGFGKPIDTAGQGQPQVANSQPIAVDPQTPEAPISALYGPTQGDYSRPTQARNSEGLVEAMSRLFGAEQQEQYVPMGDVTAGYLPSHAPAESTNPFPDIQRPVIEQERPAGLTWDQAQVALGDLTAEQELAAQQAVPAGDFGVDPDDPSSYGLNFGTGALRGATNRLTEIGADEGAESFGGKASGMSGEAVGTTASLLTTGKALAPLGLGPISQSAATLGAHAAMQPGTPEDRAIAGLQGAGTGAVFAGSGVLPGIGRYVRSNVTGPAIDMASMYGMDRASGMDNEDALINAAAMTAAGRLSHAGGRGDKTKKPLSLRDAIAAEKASYQKIGDSVIPKRRADILENVRKTFSEMKESSPDVLNEKVFKDFDKSGDVGKLILDVASVRAKAEAKRADIEATVDEKIARGQIGKENREFEVERGVFKEMFPELVDALDSGKLDLSGARKNEAEIVDMRRISQGLGEGRLGSENVVDKFLWRVNEAAHIGTARLSDIFIDRLKPIVDVLPRSDRKAMSRIMVARDEIASIERKVKQAAEQKTGVGRAISKQDLTAMQKDAAAKINELRAIESEAMAGSKNPAALESALEAMRAELDAIHTELSGLRNAFGETSVGYLENYWPMLERKARPWELRGKIREMRQPRVAQEISGKSQKARNRFEMHRTGKTINRELDPMRVIQEYARSAAKKIGHSVAVDHNNQIAKLFELYGYDDAAGIVREYNDAAYLGNPAGRTDRWLSGVKEYNDLTRVFGGILEGAGQGFKRAMFSFNLKWSLLTQGSSTLLQLGRHPELALQTAQYLAEPSFRKMIRETYSYRMKDRRQGSMTSNLTGDTVLGRRGGGLEKASDVIEYLGRFVERQTMYISGANAYARGIKLLEAGRLKDMRDVANYTSDAMAKTQSMYDRYNRAFILNNKILASENPAQSFKVEFLNSWRELLGSRYGTYQEYTGPEAVRIALQLTGFMIANTVMMQELFGHKTFTATTGIPFLSKGADKLLDNKDLKDAAPMLSYILPDSYGSGGYSESMAENVLRAAKDLADGKEEIAAARIAKMYLPAGAQVARGLQTVAAEKGEYPFELETTADKIISPMFGPYSTPSGREYIESRSGGKKQAAPARGGRRGRSVGRRSR